MAPSIVQLNVGGQLFTTTTATLTSPLANGSMLGRMIELHMQEGQPSQAGAAGVIMVPTLADPRHPGSLFIDKDGSSFSYILNYLRDGGQVVPPSDLHATQLLLREAQYYQLTGLIQLLQAHEAQLQQVKTGHQQLLQEIAQNTTTLVKDQQEQANETQLALQDIASGTASLTEYLSPHPRPYANRGQRATGPPCLLVQEMIDAVAEVLDERF